MPEVDETVEPLEQVLCLIHDELQRRAASPSHVEGRLTVTPKR